MTHDHYESWFQELLDTQIARANRLKEFWGLFSTNKGAVFGSLVIGAITLAAIAAPYVSPHPPDLQYREAILTPPAWVTGGSYKFLLGTDAVGRDILSRLIFGGRYSLSMGVIVVTLAASTGIVLGAVAGAVGGLVEIAIQRVMDIILAFPSLLLSLALVSVLGPTLENAMVAIAVVQIPHFARLTLGSVRQQFAREYVVAARMVGAGPLRIVVRTVLPNCLAPVIVQATLSFSMAILDAASLGFLGMGAQPPASEWGTMLAESREFLLHAWWIVTFPGLAILSSVLAINLVGDGLRDALDPKLRAA